MCASVFLEVLYFIAIRNGRRWGIDAYISILIISMFFLTIIGCAGSGSGNGAAPTTDTAAVAQAAADLTADDITFAGTETSSTITSSFTLPLTGTEGTTIVWTSDNGAVVITDGSAVVTQPTGSNATVTLTATITKGTITETKIITITVIKAQVWTAVGDVSGLSPDSARFTDIAINSSGVPYVVFSNNSYATVMKYNNTSWDIVGAAGFSSGMAHDTRIAFDSEDKPYVVYRDTSVDYKVVVKKFNGTSWELVGIEGFSTGMAGAPDLTFYGSTPYVAFSDDSYSNKARVMKYNGTSWENVGSAGFSSGGAGAPDLTFYSGTPYVAFSDGANSDKATVMKYNGTSWIIVGTAGFSSGAICFPRIKFNSTGTPYVSFYDVSASPNKAMVMKFNGTSWENVGSPLGSATILGETGIGFEIYSDTLYVAFSKGEYLPKPVTVTVMKYDGTNWITIGNDGFNPREFNFLNMAINSSGVPYVVFVDIEPFELGPPVFPPPPPPINKAMVMKLE